MTIQQLSKIQPDEKGMITLILDGKERRFVKDKLAKWIESNGGYIKAIIIRPPKVKDLIKRKPGRPKSERKPKKIRGERGHHRRLAINVIMPDGVVKAYPSCIAAVNELKISRTTIYRILKGGINKYGIEFKKAV